MSFLHRSALRWSDLDAQGHVNNVIFLDYMQDARAEFFKSGPASDLLAGGVVVVSHSLEYCSPISYGSEPVEIELGLSQVGAARFEMTYELSHCGELKALARSVLCPFDFKAQRPRRLSPVEREYLLRYQTAAEPLSELPNPALEGWGYPTQLNVRWSDIDSYGHVNNVKYFDYVMQARIEATTELVPTMARAGSPGESRYTWMIVRQDMYFLNQMKHRIAPYEVLTAPTRIGRSSVTLVAEITDGRNCFARSSSVLVCTDSTGRSTPLPDEITAHLGEYLIANR